MQTFLVLRSFGMFGDFTNYKRDLVSLDAHTEVMARNAQEAAKRYMKRTHALEDLSRWDGNPQTSSSIFAKLRIVPKDKPYQRFVTYWR